MTPELIFVFAICLVLASAADPVIKIENGFVKGAEKQTFGNGMTYYSFSGIPYAKPPIGNLRFASPQPANDWNGERDGTIECSICVQFNQNTLEAVGDEDCLCVNVYTPELPEGDVNPSKSVMVYIYGGGFLFGDGSYEKYGPDKLLEKNVVVVTFNYRLGCLGFLSTGDAYSPGNYGLKDQVLLLKWVQANIAHFGGNPNSVTIFGESAGGASVSYLTQIQGVQGLFHRAIMESGSALNPFGFARDPYKTARHVAEVNSVNPHNSSTIINGLRKIDAKNFVVKSTGTILLETIWEQVKNDFQCVPTLEAPSPDSVVTDLTYKILKEGRVANVPYLIGHNSLEGYTFRDFCPLAIPREINRALYTPNDANINNSILKWQLGSQIRNYYFGLLQPFSCDVRFQKFLGDDYLVRGILKHIQLLANQRTVYMYIFSYRGQLGQEFVSPDGVGHIGEIPYLFRSSKDASPGATTQDKLVSDRMTQMWANFANTGNPAPGMAGNLPVQPAVLNNNFNYLDISDSIVVRNEYVDMMRFWNYIYSFGTLVDTM